MSLSCQHSSTTSLPMRSSWARAVLTKIDNDRCLRQIDRSQWYLLSRPDLLNEDYRNLFQPLEEDEETKLFIKQSEQKSDYVFLQIVQSLLTSFLMLFMTRTSANGFLGRGRMFVYSTDQFQRLLDFHPNENSSLLDIGAGDGSVTEQMSSLFSDVFVTEMSPTMRWRLKRKGFQVLDLNDWGNRRFDVITCLNVLDRCEKPRKLLEEIRQYLRGQLIVSLVLPLKQYFEYKQNHLPDEFLQIESNRAEEQINELISKVFQPLGYRVKRITRLPYLCEGDLERSYYFLSDYLFVLEFGPMS